MKPGGSKDYSHNDKGVKRLNHKYAVCIYSCKDTRACLNNNYSKQGLQDLARSKISNSHFVNKLINFDRN